MLQGNPYSYHPRFATKSPSLCPGHSVDGDYCQQRLVA